jgi:hypothetical protein
MTFKDYYALVKRYNPSTGWKSSYQDALYAQQFLLEEFSTSHTIVQLVMDKDLDQRFVSKKAPKHSPFYIKAWIGFAMLLFIMAAIYRFLRSHEII